MTPTSRSLKLLRDTGHIACVVERFMPHGNYRLDCFGFADLLAAHPGEQSALLVQATSLSNLSARIKKAKALATLATWLRAGQRFECWGWYKIEDAKSRRIIWQVKRVAVQPGDQGDVVLEAKRRGRRKSEPDLFSGAGNVGR